MQRMNEVSNLQEWVEESRRYLRLETELMLAVDLLSDGRRDISYLNEP